jgi:hypothetical protein
VEEGDKEDDCYASCGLATGHVQGHVKLCMVLGGFCLLYIGWREGSTWIEGSEAHMKTCKNKSR